MTRSKYRGVTFHKHHRGGYTYWRSKITVDYKVYYLGEFDNEIDAALAYDEAAIRLLGENAKLNFRTPPNNRMNPTSATGL